MLVKAIISVIQAIPVKQEFLKTIGSPKPVISIAVILTVILVLGLIGFLAGFFPAKSGNEVMQLFQILVAQGKTVLIVTHDLNLGKRTQRIIYIKDGEMKKLLSDL